MAPGYKANNVEREKKEKKSKKKNKTLQSANIRRKPKVAIRIEDTLFQYCRLEINNCEYYPQVPQLNGHNPQEQNP